MAVVNIDEKKCPYKGDGMAGWGKLMAGFATSHGRLEEERCQDTTQTITDIRDLAEDVVTDYVKDSYHLTDQQRECLVNSMATACKDYNDNQWTKQQAIDDVQDITDALFDDYYKNVVPTTLNKQCTHGLYNDTSTQLILDRAYAEVQKDAAELTLQNIKDYFAQYQLLAQTLTGFIQQAINDTFHEDFNQVQDRDQTENNTQDLVRQVKEDNEQNKSLNLQDLAVDMALLMLGYAIVEAIVHRSYGVCE